MAEVMLVVLLPLSCILAVRGQFDNQFNDQFNDQFQINGQTSSNSAAAPSVDADAKLIQQTFQPHRGDGAYSFSFSTTNGITRSESGRIEQTTSGELDTNALYVQGSYSYVDPDGVIHNVVYTAGVGGFQVVDTTNGEIS